MCQAEKKMKKIPRYRKPPGAHELTCKSCRRFVGETTEILARRLGLSRAAEQPII